MTRSTDQQGAQSACALELPDWPSAEIVCPVEPREPWLEARKSLITGTDSATLAEGKLYGRTAHTIWAEKLGHIEPDDIGDVGRVRWGNLIEPVMREEGSRYLGIDLRPFPYLLRSTRNPILGASLDGDAIDANGDLCTVEIKTGIGHIDEDWQLSDALMAQVQQGLLVTGCQKAIVGVLRFGPRGIDQDWWMTVDRDAAMCEEIEARAMALWQQIQDESPPPPDTHEESGRAMTAAYLDTNPTFVRLGSEEQDLCERRQALKEQQRTIEAEIHGIDNRIKDRLRESQLGVTPNGTVVKWGKPYTVKDAVRKGFTTRRFSVKLAEVES